MPRNRNNQFVVHRQYNLRNRDIKIENVEMNNLPVNNNVPEVVDIVENNVANCQKLPVSQYGGDQVEFVDFMKDYYMYSKAYGWQERIMVTRLPLYLKGAAREAYCQLNPAQLDTWEHCKDALAEKLVTEDVGRIMRKKFYNRVQNVGESINDFAYDLSKLAEKAFGLRQLWGDHVRNILQDQFLAGIHQHIRTTLCVMEYENFDELVKKAIKIEMNSTVTTKAPTVNYVEMAKFQRPESEPSDFKSYQKPRTFNPPSPRGGRQSPKFNKNNNFRQSPQKLLTCFRCQAKGHTANQCRTKLSNNGERENNRKIIKCYNCGKMGHSAKECYAPQSRSPSRSPSPQRNKLNFKGQQQCYSCGKYGHIARSCPNNADRFQKPILKKSVKIDNNPTIKSAFLTKDDNKTFHAERDELLRKLDRLTQKFESDSETDNFMIFATEDETDQKQDVVEINKCVPSPNDDLDVDKSRLLYSHLSDDFENFEQNVGKILIKLRDMLKINVPVEK